MAFQKKKARVHEWTLAFFEINLIQMQLFLCVRLC